MKKIILLTVICALLLCACQAAENGDTSFTAGTFVSESAAEISVSKSAAETAAEAFSAAEAAAEKAPEFHEDDTITLSESQKYCGALIYSLTGELNDGCVISGSDVTVSWEGEEGKEYSAELSGNDFEFSDITCSASYTFKDVPKNKFLSVTVRDCSGDTEYPPAIYWNCIMLSDISGCGELKTAYNDDEKYIFTWEKAKGAEFYAIFLNGDLYRAVTSPQVTFSDFCAGSDNKLTVIPSAFSEDGSIFCGKISEIGFVPVKTGNIASAEYKKQSREVKSGGKTIYTSECSYPVISYADSGISDRVNEVISGCILEEKSDGDIISEYEEMTDGMGEYAGYLCSEEEQTVSVIRNTENILSVKDHYYVYSAGAVHGMYGEAYMHFDPKTGRQVKFEDIFDREAFYGGLKEKLIQQLFYDIGYEELYDYEVYLDEAFSGGYAADQYTGETGWLDKHWYYNGGVFTVFFDVYQIGSYAEGIKEASFTYDEIKDYIKDGSFLE